MIYYCSPLTKGVIMTSEEIKQLIKEEVRKQIKDYMNPKTSVSGNKRANTIAEMWNDFAEQTGLAKVKTPLSIDRVRRVNQALKEFPEPSDWVKVIEQIQEHSFYMGDNDRSWKANFDWLFNTNRPYRKLWEEAQ